MEEKKQDTKKPSPKKVRAERFTETDPNAFEIIRAKQEDEKEEEKKE